MDARDELMGYASDDAVLNGVLEEAWSVIADSDLAAGFDELHLAVLNPATASDALKGSRYFTDGAQALRDEKLIVVNEKFLLELEAAIRSFAQSTSLLGSPYLRNDGQLFGLVQRIELDPARYVARLRRQNARAAADAERQIKRELAMTTLFFLGHELGHLAGGHERGQFGAFVNPDAPLEERIEDAVVKLCRHVDEFAPAQFGLKGFEKAAEEGSDIRRIAAEYRARDERRYNRQEAFFLGEADADEAANRVVIGHLQSLEENDAEESLDLLARGLFAAALYTWYRDQLVLFQKLGIASLNDFSMAAALAPEHYIHAAELFGVHHRFTLLRAALSLEVILRARTNWFELPRETRSIHCADDAPKKEWRLSQSLQRYFLLCISMDTAVKIANMGCIAGWRRDQPAKIVMVNYEPIDEAVRWLNGMK